MHRSIEAAVQLSNEGISTEIIDLRSVYPFDVDAVRESVTKTGKLLVVDEDYRNFGLSGELAAVILEAGINCRYARVCTEGTIPYARELEDKTLPSTVKIVNAVKKLIQE